jgi:hypothetical protein
MSYYFCLKISIFFISLKMDVLSELRFDIFHIESNAHFVYEAFERLLKLCPKRQAMHLEKKFQDEVNKINELYIHLRQDIRVALSRIPYTEKQNCGGDECVSFSSDDSDDSNNCANEDDGDSQNGLDGYD